jgi:hypothetical protein
MSAAEPVAFSLVVGGPFHRALGRLRLLGGDSLPTRRTALLLALLAWLPAASLALAEAVARSRGAAWGFFEDPSALARALRERALLDYGRLANQHHLAFDRKWLAAGRDGEELLGAPDPSSISDLNASFAAVLALRVVPVDRAALLQLLLAAAIPMLAVVASRVPLLEFAKRVASVIL